MNLNILKDLSEADAIFQEIKGAEKISATKVENPEKLQELATHFQSVPSDFPPTATGYLILFGA